MTLLFDCIDERLLVEVLESRITGFVEQTRLILPETRIMLCNASSGLLVIRGLRKSVESCARKTTGPGNSCMVPKASVKLPNRGRESVKMPPCANTSRERPLSK